MIYYLGDEMPRLLLTSSSVLLSRSFKISEVDEDDGEWQFTTIGKWLSGGDAGGDKERFNDVDVENSVDGIEVDNIGGEMLKPLEKDDGWRSSDVVDDVVVVVVGDELRADGVSGVNTEPFVVVVPVVVDVAAVDDDEKGGGVWSKVVAIGLRILHGTGRWSWACWLAAAAWATAACL